MSTNANYAHLSRRINPLFAVKAELNMLLQKRDELNQKIKALESALASLAQAYEVTTCLFDDDRQQRHAFRDAACVPALPRALNDGMTKRIFDILVANGGRELSPVEIRDLLVTSGFELDGRSNPMAEIHQVLKRLAKNEDLFVVALPLSGKGGCLYKYDVAASVAMLNRDDEELFEENEEKQGRARIGT